MGKRKGIKYNQIIDAAVRVIARHGYHQAQVSKIAKEAGVADGTIYLYFSNKEDILISLFEEKMGVFVDEIRTKIALLDKIEEKFLLSIQMHFAQLQAEKQLAIVTQLELRQSNLELRQRINQILKEYLQLLDELIIEGKETGYFRADLNTRLARQMIFGTLDEIVTTWVMKDCKYDLTAQAKPVQELFLKGLAKN